MDIFSRQEHIKFQTDGTIEWTYDTLSLSHNDSTYTDLNLSAVAFRNFYLDNIVFSSI